MLNHWFSKHTSLVHAVGLCIAVSTAACTGGPTAPTSLAADTAAGARPLTAPAAQVSATPEAADSPVDEFLGVPDDTGLSRAATALVSSATCAVTLTPTRKSVTTDGARFAIAVRFPNAPDPSACGRWTFKSDDGMRLLRSASGSRVTGVSGTGNGSIDVDVPDSVRYSSSAAQKRVLKTFSFSGAGGNDVSWRLTATRWCPELRWCS